MRFLYNASIWAPDAIPEEEWKYRNLKRVMFPLFDILMICAGISAHVGGIWAISEFFPRAAVDWFALTVIAAGVISLIGVVFPSQWRLEILGKVSLFGLLTAYITALSILSIAGIQPRPFGLFMAASALCPIVWQLSILGAEWQTRRIEARVE